MTTATVLDRDIFSEAEAARLLRVAQSTLHYWLDGGQRRGRVYPPVIRVEARGERQVTWAEFVEAGLLRSYRRDLQVPMTELRNFIDYLRQEYQVPYPLAHEQPLVSGRTLVLRAQEATELSSDFWLVTDVGGQMLLTPPGADFLKRVRFEAGVAASWRPHDDVDSPVQIEPLRRSGRPNVAGISTEAIWEHVEAGEAPEDVAEAFDLSRQDVSWALAYEYATRASAA
jgi:uncharacterized protein (DUF433 family)